MTDITIPPEVIEAALEAFALASGLGIFPDDEKDEEWREDLQIGMRAACLAMLNAWPGMTHIIEGDPGRENAEIILPLPKEASDE